MVEVLYVDFGNTEFVHVTNLREPTQNNAHVLSLPFQVSFLSLKKFYSIKFSSIFFQYIEITLWLVSAYDFYSQVVKDR